MSDTPMNRYFRGTLIDITAGREQGLHATLWLDFRLDSGAILHLVDTHSTPEKSILWDKSTQTAEEFLAEVLAPYGDVKVPADWFRKIQEFEDIYTNGWRVSVDMADDSLDYDTDLNGEGGYFDPTYCDSCGSYSDNIITVTYFPAFQGGKRQYQASLQYRGGEGCFGREEIDGPLRSSQKSILAALKQSDKDYGPHPEMEDLIKRVESLA